MNAAWIVMLLTPLQEPAAPQAPVQEKQKPKLAFATPSTPQAKETPRATRSLPGQRVPEPTVIFQQVIPTRVQLQPEDFGEIRRIRDRIGLRLFDDPKSDREFARHLEDLAKSEISDESCEPTPVVQPARAGQPAWGAHAWQACQPFDGMVGLIWVPINGGHATPPSGEVAARWPRENATRENGKLAARSQALRESLLQAIENLDGYALELERAGQFADSEKPRRLSRQIRQRLKEMPDPRDN